jgi:predicted transcriptional regulator
MLLASLCGQGDAIMKEQVAEIVAAFVQHNQVASTELSALITSVSQAFDSLGKAPATPAAFLVPPKPAVSIRQSIRPDYLVCLTCGRRSKMLKWHLLKAHNLTPDEYRSRWGLRGDYPMVAPTYSARRSDLAKSLGLGHHGGGRRRRAS